MKNFIGRLILLSVFALLAFNPEINAHRINFETSTEPPVITVKAFFSRTAPLVGAMVDVYAPGDDQPYQTGRTDKAGFFAFIPDRTGEWTMRVDDERGHVDRVTVEVAGTFFSGDNLVPEETHPEEIQERMVAIEKTGTGNDFQVFYRVITGLALIFGLTGIIYGVKARQAMRNNS